MLEKIKQINLVRGYEKGFLKEIFIKSFFICCLVWSFMIVQFWWGNHDWGYIKNRVKIADGFFEARYSQHLFSVVLFDGQILPVLAVVSGLAALVALSVLLAVYLRVLQKKGIFYIFVLFVCLNPYLFVLFYYVYLILPFMAWPLVGVYGLLLCEVGYERNRFLGCAFIWFLILGSYPPNIALILTVFTVRRLLCYCYEGESFREVIKKCVYLGGQFILGFVGFKIVYVILKRNHFLNLDMYNIKMRGWPEIFFNIPTELVKSVGQMFDVQTFLGWNYCILLFIPIVAAIFLLYYRCDKNRIILSLLVIGVLLSSRFAFLVAERSEIGFFRMEYFGRLGLGVFALAILGRMRSLCVQNLYLLWGVVTLLLFIRSDFYLQKVQLFGFQTGRKYQARVVDRIVQHPNFEMKEKYITFSFGYPNFREHFYEDKYQTGEMVGHTMVFYHYIISGLFWEEKITPEAIGSGINGETILRVDHSEGGPYWLNRDYWQNNPENMSNIRYWLYMEAKQNDVYIDDKYIILVLDMLNLYKNRELVITKLDE